MKERNLFYAGERSEWRRWLSEHFDSEEEIWFVFPTVDSGEKSVSYNDAARKRPQEFEKRLKNFINKTRDNKLIIGYGGIEKYYR